MADDGRWAIGRDRSERAILAAMTDKPRVRMGGRRPRVNVVAGEAVESWRRQGDPKTAPFDAPERRLVRRIPEVTVQEVDEPDPEVRAEAADRPSGAPIQVESQKVLGGGSGRVTRSAPLRSGQSRGRWLGGDNRLQQDAVLDRPVEGAEDSEAVPAEQRIQRAQVSGPPEPTGEPCTCKYEWETDAETGEIVVYDIGGLATGFRGARSYMTWCLVCGGERGDNGAPLFKPSSRRYGSYQPEVQPVARVQRAPEVDEDQLAARVTGKVMEEVASYLGSDRFTGALAAKVAEAAQKAT